MRQFKKNWKCDLEAALNEIEVRCLSFIYFLGGGGQLAARILEWVAISFSRFISSHAQFTFRILMA